MLCEPMTTLEAGDTLDHYRLDATVARSGMSTLFKATDLKTGRQVAIKVPHAEMEADPILIERFKRERQIGQELDHPGIVKTFDGEVRSHVYMVIEWVDGKLLRSILSQSGRLPIDRAIHLTLAICDALDYMHKHGVVHRDLKPENIMVGVNDSIKLIDFGIAMKEDARRLTYAGPSPMLGTPDYIAPEQVKGQRGDQRSDIYALGTIFYEMLAGQTPFSGPNPLAVMNERLLNDPKPSASCALKSPLSCRRFSIALWNATRATATQPPVRWPGSSPTRSRSASMKARTAPPCAAASCSTTASCSSTPRCSSRP